MKKTQIQFKLPVTFLKEGKFFIAYSPALDISTSGKTYGEAKQRFEEIVDIFFEETAKRGSLKSVLEKLGWKKTKKHWMPPIVINNELQEYSCNVC